MCPLTPAALSCPLLPPPPQIAAKTTKSVHFDDGANRVHSYAPLPSPLHDGDDESVSAGGVGGFTETRSQKRLRLSEEAVLKESDPERWELTIANTDANSRKRKRD